jgi:prepilin-type N-terminal cleavage/methylation domain-containing protein
MLDVGKNKIAAFTLTEVLSALIIIAILAALALPQFNHAKERTLAREAKANLKLIDAAEKIYRMEEGFYYPYSGTVNSAIDSERQDIYSYLKLATTNTTAVRNWDYIITGNSTDPGTSYSSIADRTGSGGDLDCQYKMDSANATIAAEPKPANPLYCP